MAAPAFGTAGTTVQGTASTAAVPVPASVASGDIILVALYCDTTTTITGMASGFANVANSPLAWTGSGVKARLYVMWKRASGSDTGTYDFTLSASDFRVGGAVRYTSCLAAGTPFDTAGGGDTPAVADDTSGTTTPSVNITTLGPDRALMHFDANWTGGAWTPPTGFTERFESTTELIISINEKTQTAAGNSGGIVATCAGSGKRMALVVALIGTTVDYVRPTIVIPTGAVQRAGSW